MRFLCHRIKVIREREAQRLSNRLSLPLFYTMFDVNISS